MSCDACANPGAFWDGKPTGEVITYEGSEAYVARPKTATKKAILYIPDVHGWDLPNARLYADKFAENGFLAVAPDYFAGNPVPLKALQSGDMETFMAWYKKVGPDVSIPLSDKFIGYLKSQGATSVGAIGICWGGKPAVILAASDKIQAVVVNHGSFVKEEDVKAIKQPALFNGADNDQQISKDQFKLYQKIMADSKVPEDFKFFEGAEHGWTVRGDTKDPKIAAQVADAFERAVSWFNKHL